MANAKQQKQGSADAPHGGMPGDGAGRREDPQSRDSGVWPVSGPPSGNPEARTQGMASFGQGERGAAGYEDSGRSEVITMPPGDGAGGGRRGQAGPEGSNAGEVDPGISGSSETVGDQPAG